MAPLTAYEAAMKLLGRKELTRAELLAKLVEYEDVESAVDLAAARGLQSDVRVVEVYLRQRGEGSRAYGRPRLREELLARGVPDGMVEEALAALPDESERARSLLRGKPDASPSFILGRGFEEDPRAGG